MSVLPNKIKDLPWLVATLKKIRTKNLCLVINEGSLVNKTDLQALYLSGTYCHMTGCVTPRQRTIYAGPVSARKAIVYYY